MRCVLSLLRCSRTGTILELGEHEADDVDEDYDEVADGEGKTARDLVSGDCTWTSRLTVCAWLAAF